MAYVPAHPPPPPAHSFLDDSSSSDGGSLSPDPPWGPPITATPTAPARWRMWATGPRSDAVLGVDGPGDPLPPRAWQEVLDTFYLVRRFESGYSQTTVFLGVAKAEYEAARAARSGSWKRVNIKTLLRAIKIRHISFEDPVADPSHGPVIAKAHPPYWEIYVARRPTVQHIINKGNAVPVTHVGEDDDWFAAPFCGVSLYHFYLELRRREIRFSIPLAWHIFHESIRIVATLQDGVEQGGQPHNPQWHSVIHGDLGENNLMLQCGPTGRVKPVLIDWGQAITNEDPKNGTITWNTKAFDSGDVAKAIHASIHQKRPEDRNGSSAASGNSEFCDCNPQDMAAVGHTDHDAERKIITFVERFTKTRNDLSGPTPLTARRGLRRMDDPRFWQAKDNETLAKKRVTMPQDHRQAYNSLLPDYAAILRMVEDQWRAANNEALLPPPAPAAAPVAPAPVPAGMLVQERTTRGKRRRDEAAGVADSQTFDGYDDPDRVWKRPRRRG